MKFKRMDVSKEKLMENLESLERINEKRAREYRKLANVKDDVILTEDKLDRWALHVASVNTYSSEDDVKKAVLENHNLTEGVTIDQALKDLDAEKENIVKNSDDNKSAIEEVLDRSLEEALRIHSRGKRGDFPNVLFIGTAGTGKSSIVRTWANENGINLFEVRAAGMDATDLGGAVSPNSEGKKTVDRLASTEFDKLNRPNSVLFLDEYNRAPSGVRTNLLELVNSHVVPDERDDDGQRFLPNFLFTVAAINPPNSNYDTDEMDGAEKTRFRKVKVGFDPLQYLKHITKELDDDLKSPYDEKERLELIRKKKLVKSLLTSPKFEFDTEEDEAEGEDKLGLDYSALNYRSLTGLINACDGTKDDFLDLWSEFVNPLKKNMAEDILDNYEDIDDKANDALKGGTTSQVFKKKASLSQTLLNKIK